MGEHIELRLDLTPDLQRVQTDPAQLHQLNMNLVLNAQDAMPQGGVLTIATANVLLDAGFAQSHPGSQVGPHVRLSIQDTGMGMDSETQVRLFEPFFTTKRPGKGTGLGLSTVYGIVKQNKGYVAVETALGQGTTFKIYFPQSSKTAQETPARDQLAAAQTEARKPSSSRKTKRRSERLHVSLWNAMVTRA